MTSPATAIYNELSAIVADPLHASGLHDLVTGQVWNRRLVKPPSPGATTAAYDSVGRPLISIVIPGYLSDVDDLGPQSRKASISAMMSFPQIWFYGQARDSDRTVLETLVWTVYELITGELSEIEGPDGSSIGLRVIGRNGVDDEPAMENTIFDMLRLQADGLWIPEGA